MIKKYLVIGNPIEHSMSPKLHNHWLKENNIKAVYEKKQIEENNIEEIISISGIDGCLVGNSSLDGEQFAIIASKIKS